MKRTALPVVASIVVVMAMAGCAPESAPVPAAPSLPTEMPASTSATLTNTLAPEATLTNTPPPPTATPSVEVQAEFLNVRRGPGTIYDRIGQVQQGDQLALLAKNPAGNWYQICCVNGQQGWVSAKYVQPSSPAENVPVALTIPPTPTPSPTPDFHCVYVGSTLCPGYDIGVDDSADRRDWLHDMDGYMRMAYPGGLVWGAVFITVGPPTDPPRPKQDLSAYNTLSLELRGGHGRRMCRDRYQGQHRPRRR